MRQGSCKLIGEICLIVSLQLMWQARAAASEPGDFVGEWSSGTLVGAGSVNNAPQCTGMAWEIRTVKLETVQGNPTRLRGEWARNYNTMWMNTNQRTCRWPGVQDFDTPYIAVVDWSLSGTFDASTNSLRVKGTFETCGGKACSALGPQKDFDTEFKLFNGELIDTSMTESYDDDRAFVKRGVEADKKDSAIREVKRIVTTIDAGDADGVYDQADDSFRRSSTREDWRKTVKTMRSMAGPPLSRSVVTCVYALYFPALAKARGEYAYVLNGVYLAGNRSGLEHIILRRDGNAWRVVSYYLGS